jgi:methyl-accepting chemotaxis protein
MQGVLRGLNEFIIDEGEPLSVALVKKNMESLEETHMTLMPRIENKELKMILEEGVDNRLQIFKKGVLSFIETSDISSEGAELMRQYGTLISNADKLVENFEKATDLAQNIAKKTTKKTISFISFISLAFIVIIAITVFKTYQTVIIPIKDLKDLMQQVLDKEGDLTHRINIKGNDEIASTAFIFNKILDKLLTVITKVANITTDLAANSAQLSSSTTEVDSGTVEASKQISDLSNSTLEISNAITLVAENAADLSYAIKESANVAIEGKDVVDETGNEIVFIAQTVEMSAFTVQKLGNSSGKINDIVKVIDDIAGQTNLLALNAAIEAARAGEEGRGFAVVADEVRKLAERTGIATGEISGTIKQIQEDTQLSIKNMDEGRSKVEHGIHLAEKAKTSLERIVKVSKRNLEMVEGIDNSTVTQSQSMEKVSSNMEQMTNIANSSQSAMSQINQASEQLAQLAYELKAIIGWFTISKATEDITVNDADNMPVNNKVEHTISN